MLTMLRSRAMIVDVDDVDALNETIEILSDLETMAALRQAEDELDEGLGMDEAEVRASLAARRS